MASILSVLYTEKRVIFDMDLFTMWCFIVLIIANGVGGWKTGEPSYVTNLCILTVGLVVGSRLDTIIRILKEKR